MKSIPGRHLRARKKVQERVRHIIIVHINQSRFHDVLEGLTK
jgi:hypothetical protein